MARMLVVDDDPAWRALYRMAFEGQFEIFEATDGQQGLAVFDAVKPDVIVLDLRMPKMMVSISSGGSATRSPRPDRGLFRDPD